MKLLVDMNLSPDWIPVLQRHGYDAVHWSTVGDIRATDELIMAWAAANGCVVFTHDLDFGTLLAVTGATGPSVIQVRTQDVSPAHLAATVVAAELEAGALVVVDEARCRVHVLPLVR